MCFSDLLYGLFACEQEVTHYLVKWCSLPYEESTWELQEDVDPVKIKEFEDLKKIPEIKHVVMPHNLESFLFDILEY